MTGSSFLKKSTARDFDLLACDTMRLGTLSYYRSLAKNEIGDPFEGRSRTSIELTGNRVVTKSFLSNIMPGAYNFDNLRYIPRRPFSANLKRIMIKSDSSGSNLAAILDASYEYHGSDALVFCMSISDSKLDAPELGYDHAWFISRGRAAEFARQLKKSLHRLGPGFREGLLHPDAMTNRYADAEFIVEHGPVLYCDLSRNYSDPEAQVQKEILWRMKNPDFLKQWKFAHQREYRFCARLIVDGHVLPLGKPHADLPSTDFRRFLI
jgi:hypothetical protein